MGANQRISRPPRAPEYKNVALALNASPPLPPDPRIPLIFGLLHAELDPRPLPPYVDDELPNISQKRIVSSALALHIVLPSGERAKWSTREVCPWNSCSFVNLLEL